MKTPLHFLAAAFLFLVTANLIGAGSGKSLLPPFGTEGDEFSAKGQGTHTVHGWLPKEWKDNSEWASVSATYTKLTDSPDKDAGAVRIKIEKVEEGQLQLTTYGGNQKYAQGKTYHVTGWVRSPDRLEVTAGARQMGDPYEMYHEQSLTTGSDWKPFDFSFKPSRDLEAFIMFIVKDTGTVDFAGVSVTVE